jgi:hypothetical protein
MDLGEGQDTRVRNILDYGSLEIQGDYPHPWGKGVFMALETFEVYP